MEVLDFRDDYPVLMYVLQITSSYICGAARTDRWNWWTSGSILSKDCRYVEV